MRESRRRFLQDIGATAAAATVSVTSTGAARAAHEKDKPRTEDADLPSRLMVGHIRRGGNLALAVKTELGVLDVHGAAETLNYDVPHSLDEMLREGGGQLVSTVVLKARGAQWARRHFFPEDQVEFGPPVMHPEKIICVGLNYRKHAAETGAQVPATPMLFNKYNNTLMGHRGKLALPAKVANQFDYEVELVVVMGKKAHEVSEADALGHVFGYAIGNDFSARDLQRKTSQFMLGKSCDGFAPLGPWIVGAGLVPDPQKLDLWCEVNGQRRQASNTADMVFSCAQIVSYISQHMTLMPGDIIFTGTPEGVIAGMPEGKRTWLKSGDSLRCAVEPLGVLEFRLT
jgi:2-keto-4-pentenoate hydratase/2-oxohepta-3-ene-1,7-dioic acid hydratase in catechol pathway